jgi:hypothetical protein
MKWRLEHPGEEDGEARLVETDGERAELDVTRPFPTGTTLVGIETDTQIEYQFKVRHCRRQEEGWYRVEGRFVSLTKEQRQAVLAAVGRAED